MPTGQPDMDSISLGLSPQVDLVCVRLTLKLTSIVAREMAQRLGAVDALSEDWCLFSSTQMVLKSVSNSRGSGVVF